VTSPEERVAELLSIYGTVDACPARLLCDDHPAERVAFTVVEPDLSTKGVTYGELREQSERFAAALNEMGVGPGDRVGVLMGKSADLATVLVGIWRRGAVLVPLFTAFAPPAIALRLLASGAKAVVADADQRSKLDASDDIPADAPWQIITAGSPEREGDLHLEDLLAAHDSGLEAEVVGGDAPLVMIYTSGTTGAPKGVVWTVRGLGPWVGYLEYGFDLGPDDVYWNAADPGWAYGLFYAIIAPLAAGRCSILLRAGFSADLTWQVLDQLQVTNFAAAPTVFRALRSGSSIQIPENLPLRCISSAGEPLNPDVISWAEETLGVTIRDHYGQTELGMVIANGWHPDIQRPVKFGSMGYSLPGWRAEVLLDEADEIAPPGTLGRVVVDVNASPQMLFSGYHEAPDKTAERFCADGRWYLTGDTGSRDEDGYFTFSSRDDDVIIMAGYRIGPFEVESALMQHLAVAEAAIVGVPDELRGEILEAFVVLRPGVVPSDELSAALQQQVRTRFSAHAYPRVVHFIDELPKTPSGKIQRYVLRERRRAKG
jgi:acetyl-CoA synthetase